MTMRMLAAEEKVRQGTENVKDKLGGGQAYDRSV
jgi:hypothetical protein